MTNKYAIDPALINRIAKGDREAERQLFREFDIFVKLGFIVRARVQVPREEQDDLVADIAGLILQLLRNGKYDPSRGSLGSYVKGVARNKIREYFRGTTKQIATSDVEIDELSASEEEDDPLEMKERFAAVTGQLAQKYREVIIARYYKNMAIADIAALLELTEKQVYNRLHYALRLIKEKL